MILSFVVELNGLERAALLSAFQAMDMTAKHGLKKAYGVSNKQACRLVERLTGVKPQGPARGRTLPEQYGPHEDVLDRYLHWLFVEGTRSREYPKMPKEKLIAIREALVSGRFDVEQEGDFEETLEAR